jgi:hypothetical protein
MLLLAMAVAAATAPKKMQTPSAQMRGAIVAKVGDKLMDGASARYRWPKEDFEGALYCGFVNAKNSYGAYIGFRPFMILGAHANGPNGDGSYKIFAATITGIERDNDTAIVAKMCGEAGFDLASLPAVAAGR